MPIPQMMKAIVHNHYGGPEVLHLAEVPTPEPGPRDVLLRVKAVSVNPVDTKRRAGGPPNSPVPDAPAIIGWDAAGIVDAVGNGVTLFKPGDEVYCAGDITRPGSYAQYLAVDERIVGRKPHSLTFEEAAAVPLTALTAWEGMFEMIDMQPGQGQSPCTVLIVGGAGGAGSIAIQLAKKVARMRVVATASRPESADYCRQMGADGIINHYHDFRPQLKDLGLDGVDYIFNTAKLDNFDQLVASLKPLGKICTILAGEAGQNLNVSGLFPLRGTLAFELMFTRPRLGVEPEKQGQILNRVAELLDDGTLVTTMTREFSWEAVQEVHRAIETGRTIGKLVMRVE